MVDPDEMSVPSDDDEVMSAIAAEEDEAEMHPDSDGEDGADEEPPDSENGDDAAAPADDEEEAGGEEEESKDAVPQTATNDDDDEDAIPQADSDNEEEKEKEKEAQKAVQQDAQKKPKAQTKGIMRHFHVKQQGSSSEKVGPSKSAEATKPPTSGATRAKGGKAAAAAAASAQPIALGQNGGSKGGKAKATERAQKPAASAAATKKAKDTGKSTTSKSSEAKQPPPQSDFSFQDSEEEEVEMTMPQNKGVPLTAPPDAEQEYEDLHKGGGESARGASGASTPQEAPQVAELAKKRRYVVKNEKTKRWAEWLPKGLLYAPECSELFAFGLDDLTMQSKKDRIAAQTKLADSEMDKIMQTLCVSSFTADAAGSASGPGITNLMAGVPSELPLQDKELNDLMDRVQKREALADGVQVVLLHVLDHDIMKRIYKVSNAPLPGMYNPNTNPSNKFKVPSQVEKAKETDENFIDLGIIETNKRQRAPKRTGEERPNGQKPEGKRPATGAATSATNGVPGEIPGKEGVGPGEYSNTFFKGFHDEGHAIAYAKLTCKENEVFTVLKCSSGKWLLMKSIEE